MHRPPFISILKYLVFLSIALAACDDSPSSTSTADTGPIGDTNASDTTPPDTSSDTSAETGQPDTTGGTGVNTDPAAVQTAAVDDHSRTVVNASSPALWTHLSLSTGQLAVPAPTGTDAFHLGFQRYLVRLGDGVSALTLDGIGFASLGEAPDREEADWKVDGGTPETAAISDWWDYDGQNHVLSAKPDRLYVIRADGRYFKVRFRDYYDAGGNPGLVTLDWAEIDGPGVSGE